MTHEKINTLSPNNASHLCVLSAVLSIIGAHATRKSIEEVQAYTHRNGDIIYVAANDEETPILITACEILLTAIHPCTADAIMEAARVLHILFCETAAERASNQNIPAYADQESWLNSNRTANNNGNLTTPSESELIRWKFLDHKPNSLDTSNFITSAYSKSATQEDILNKIKEMIINIRLNPRQINGIENIVNAFKSKTALPKSITLTSISKIEEAPAIGYALRCVTSTKSHAEITLMRALIIGGNFTSVIDGNLGGKKTACAECSTWFSRVKVLSKDKINPRFPLEESFENLRAVRKHPGKWESPIFNSHNHTSEEYKTFRSTYTGLELHPKNALSPPELESTPKPLIMDFQ